MKEKNYNLELIRMISFIFVIVIHVSNYYCRAYGDITIGEYSFSLLLNLLARISVPCFFMITGALLLGRQESLHKHAKRIFQFSNCSACVECNIYDLECSLYGRSLSNQRFII